MILRRHPCRFACWPGRTRAQASPHERQTGAREHRLPLRLTLKMILKRPADRTTCPDDISRSATLAAATEREQPRCGGILCSAAISPISACSDDRALQWRLAYRSAFLGSELNHRPPPADAGVALPPSGAAAGVWGSMPSDWSIPRGRRPPAAAIGRHRLSRRAHPRSLRPPGKCPEGADSRSVRKGP